MGVAVAVVLVAAGCGSGGTGGGTTTTAATVATTGAPSTTAAPTTVGPGSGSTAGAADLAGRLLTAGDLPAGWQAGPAVNEQDLGDAGQIACPEVSLDPAVARRLRPVTGAQFEPADRSSRHLIEFVTTGEPAALDTDLKVYVAAMGSCPAGGPVTVEPLTLPALGQQQAGFRTKATVAPGTVWYVRSGIVRVGPVAVSVNLTEILAAADQPPTVTDDAFVAIVARAVARLGT